MSSKEAVSPGKSVKEKKAALLERLKAHKTGNAQPNAKAEPEAPVKKVEFQPEANMNWSLFNLGKAMGYFGENQVPTMKLFTYSAVYPSEEQRKFFYSMDSQIKLLCTMLEEPSEEGEKKPVDMQLCIGVSSDAMEAWGFLLPAINGGANINKTVLDRRLEEEKISFGLNTGELLEAANNGNCLKLFVIANGFPGEDGINGQVIDHFSRDKKIHLEASKDDSIDYRNLHWLQKITAETVICELIQPIPANPGTNVHGTSISRKQSKMPQIPSGTNTKLNEDKTALLATCDGQLNFRGGKFHVDQVLKISGDVDNSVGNLDVIGDLDIKGNVGDGYTLKATGNIMVHGLVEGAALEAGGSIQVNMGVKGNFKGRLSAQENIVCKYMENATANAGKSVAADSLINCHVYSGDVVTANSGQGVIVGGVIVARNRIEAKIIGNESNRETKLSVGADPAMLENIVTLKKELEVKYKEIKENQLNINYLEKANKQEKSYQDLLSKLKLKLSIDKMSCEKKQRQIVDYEEQLDDTGCQIVASTIYPHTGIDIGGIKTVVRTKNNMCRVYKDNGEINFGSK